MLAGAGSRGLDNQVSYLPTDIMLRCNPRGRARHTASLTPSLDADHPSPIYPSVETLPTPLATAELPFLDTPRRTARSKG